ncbi:hypothetical protein IU494_30260 [Nocardia terpenica]|uniref:colicin D domain-containing protein n=1 Tax=Nocardia terpenica TaxID=455432 RepID=UPI0018959507|nr:colicin D domain-containing protein [Nocardia terpenica]MBF6064932.1 hypothetical protein [Nocardia terpenica]MBF6115204.1 hypothetical protein [Nocardia terpenica]MBF6122526.1 hypothetical protein [Nocardia terpenica]
MRTTEELEEPGLDGGAGEEGPLYNEMPEELPREPEFPDGEEDSGHASKMVAPAVETVEKVPVKIDPKQVEKKYKHAPDFGVTDPRGKGGFDKFAQAVKWVVDDPATIHIKGSYRGQPAILNYDPNGSLIVVQDMDGQFVSGWKLNDDQTQSVLNRGKLGGG